MPLPIYEESGKTYAADTCEPVRRAVAAGQIRWESLARGHYPGRRLSRTALPGVKTVGFWDADKRQDWGLDWHRNEGIELTLLETGSIAFAVDGHAFPLHGNDLTVTRPWQQHRLGDPAIGAGRLHWLILDVDVRRPHQPWRWPPWIVLTPSDLRELTDILRHNEQPAWRATTDVARCFQRIASAVETDRDGSSVSRLAVQINELLLATLEMFRRRDVPLDESLSTTRRTVELFWADLQQNREELAAEWTVARMARRCGMGVTNFIHCTKTLTNQTPNQYLGHCRLAAAAELLKSRPEQSITDVAFACGFTSSQYFATQFRNQFGATPREYREGKVTTNRRR
jgi:AraC-like DNA-binding protein